MNFNEKLQHLRASRKLSQEELAGRLDVSRQAVTKRENGQAFPDFPNLVRLSELFGVSIDRLVRQEEECAPALLDPDPASEKALRRFLMRAKQRTYASGQNTAPPSRPQSHDFRYSEQDYLSTPIWEAGILRVRKLCGSGTLPSGRSITMAYRWTRPFTAPS